MASRNYMSGRKKYQRPQALLFADNPGTLVEYPADSGHYIHLPSGYEIGTDSTDLEQSELDQFIILSDDNRQEIQFNIERIENRQRMVNGRMRSYHVADKRTLSVSWEMLPSRSFYLSPEFDPTTGLSTYNGQSGKVTGADRQYTTDAGAGGVDILDWYNSHQGSFWVYLSYDNHANFSTDKYSRLAEYNEVIEVFFSSFEYSVVKRGGSNHDFWNISLSLEEV